MDVVEMDRSVKSQRLLKLERTGPWLLGALVALLFVPTWVRHIYRTSDPFTFNDDARILIWPFFRQTDATLFPDDPFATYYQSGLPEGYLALYRIFGLIGWVRPASEVLQYVTVIVALTLIVITARRLGGSLAAFIAAVLSLGSDAFLDRAGGGLPRGFAFPLIAAGLYALVTARPLLLAVLAVAGAAFYPVVAALLGASLFVLLVLPARLRESITERSEHHSADPERRDNAPSDQARRDNAPSDQARRDNAPSDQARREPELAAHHASWTWQRRGIVLVATLFGIVVLLIPTTLRLKGYGEAIGPDLLSRFPEAALGGRLSPEHHPPFESFVTAACRHLRVALLGAGDPIGMYWGRWIRQSELRSTIAVLAIATWSAVCTLVQVRQRPELLRLWVLPIVACLLHPVACWVAPHLFLPERYVQFAIPPFAVLLVSVGLLPNVAAAGSQIVSWAPRRASPARMRSTPRAAGSWIVSSGPRVFSVAAILATLAGRGTSWAGIEVHVPENNRALYHAVAELPKDVLIAGWPIGPIENIPYLAERRVLSNYQLEIPFHTRFTLDSRARLRALFEAYFATSLGPIERLCSEFHVTHLLIDHNHFGGSAPDYYEPHRATIARLRASAQTAFVLPQMIAQSSSAWHFDQGQSLVELSRLPGLAAHCRQTNAAAASIDEAGRRLP